MKIISLWLYFICVLYTKDILEVTAVKLIADENKGIIELVDNVKIKKNDDELFASKVIINVDKNRVPTGYSAYGGVTFSITTKDKRKFYGKSNEAFYNVLSGEYRLIGNSELNQENSINKVKGDEIIVNNNVGYVNIIGDNKKPAKVIFELEEQNAKK